MGLKIHTYCWDGSASCDVRGENLALCLCMISGSSDNCASAASLRNDIIIKYAIVNIKTTSYANKGQSKKLQKHAKLFLAKNC